MTLMSILGMIGWLTSWGADQNMATKIACKERPSNPSVIFNPSYKIDAWRDYVDASPGSAFDAYTKRMKSCNSRKENQCIQFYAAPDESDLKEPTVDCYFANKTAENPFPSPSGTCLVGHTKYIDALCDKSWADLLSWVDKCKKATTKEECDQLEGNFKEETKECVSFIVNHTNKVYEYSPGWWKHSFGEEAGKKLETLQKQFGTKGPSCVANSDWQQACTDTTTTWYQCCIKKDKASWENGDCALDGETCNVADKKFKDICTAAESKAFGVPNLNAVHDLFR